MSPVREGQALGERAMSQDESQDTTQFSDLGLAPVVLDALEKLEFKTPTPIQQRAIPVLLEGHDMIGQAQTGTGKTAAFALPFLSGINLKRAKPQMLVLAPTRELALQVSEAVVSFGKGMKGLKVLPVYGGQGMEIQLRSLKRGVHIVVGTPGRVIDHLERGTLDLAEVRAFVLDEADEMLRMGFMEEVEKVLEALPKERQTALFSATMPPRIQQIAMRFLNDPVEVKVKGRAKTVDSVDQKLLDVAGEQKKTQALMRILEGEDHDGVLVFVRTRAATAQLAEQLEQGGVRAEPLSGEMSQPARQKTVDRFKMGKVDILVCTDVAARGIDVARVSLVVNYHLPKDPEIYVHRIGRTGRAGREGRSITFASRRERNSVRNIERMTGSTLEFMDIPTVEQVEERRLQIFSKRLRGVLEKRDLAPYKGWLETLVEASETDLESVAMALLHLAQKDQPFKVKPLQLQPSRNDRVADSSRRRGQGRGRDRGEARAQDNSRRRGSLRDGGGDRDGRRRGRGREDRYEEEATSIESMMPVQENRNRQRASKSKMPMETYRVEVGSEKGVEPRHLVGAIANEAGLEPEFIGSIHIEKDHALVDLPKGMPPETLDHMQTVWACGAQLRMKPAGGSEPSRRKDSRPSSRRPGRSAGPRTKSEGQRKSKASGKPRKKAEGKKGKPRKPRK